jgi:N-acetylneuraminic acid mutarotase
MTTIDNTIYVYGGVTTGKINANTVLNIISSMDTNSFETTPLANGMGLMEHSTCYLPSTNALILFGGSQTGASSDATNASFINLCMSDFHA